MQKLQHLLSLPLQLEQEPADELEMNRVRSRLRDLLAGLLERGVRGGPLPVVVVVLWAWCEGRWGGEGAVARLLAQGRSTEEGEVVVAVLRAVQGLVVRGEGGEEALAWVEECGGHEEEEVRRAAEDAIKVVALARRGGSPEVEEAVEGGLQGGWDWSLGFLDTCVVRSLEKGQAPYRPSDMRGARPARAQESTEHRALNMAPYTQLRAPSVSEASFASSEEGPPAVWTLEGRMEEEEGQQQELGGLLGASQAALQSSPQSSPQLPSLGSLEDALSDDWS